MSYSDSLSPVHLAAQAHPKALAISWHAQGARQQLDYRALSQCVISVGQQLISAGLAPGDKLACIGKNSAELIVLYWACIDQGVLFCPLSPRFPLTQINQLTEKYHLNAIWAPELNSEQLTATSLQLSFSSSALFSEKKQQVIDTLLPANIILTSGSSGFPKAAVHSLSNHIASAKGSRTLIPLQLGDHWLLSLPIFHIGGLAIINRCTLAGATLVLEDKHTPLAQQVSRDEISHLSLVSTQLVRLLEQDASSLKRVKALLLGGGAIPQNLLSKLKELGVISYTSYGMTEMGSQITTGFAKSDGSSGKLLPGRQLKIVKDNIHVRGETLFLGYLKPGITEHTQIERPLDADGWFDTKDRGEWNSDGNLQILGRSDNMFICGGENIQPEEIEAILKLHPQVEDAIVFPQADDEFGNLPAAIVKGKLSAKHEYEALVCQHAARFKRPRHYYSWPEIESNSLKVSRKQVIEEVLRAASN